MSATSPAPLGHPRADARQAGVTLAPADLAKAAFRRLVSERLEPTPDNFGRAYRAEATAAGLRIGGPSAGHGVGDVVDAPEPAQGGRQMAQLLDRLVRSMESGSRYWTLARKKQSLQHVLRSSESDARRLELRLNQLLASWEREPDAGTATSPSPLMEMDVSGLGDSAAFDLSEPPIRPHAGAPLPNAKVSGAALELSAPMRAALLSTWRALAESAAGDIASDETAVPDLVAAHAISERLVAETPLPADDPVWQQIHEQAPVLGRRLARNHELVGQLTTLAREMVEGLGAFADEDGWVDGQVQVIRQELEQGVTARSVRLVAQTLRETTGHQRELAAERRRATTALRRLIERLLEQLGSVGNQTGRFETDLEGYAARIADAESLEGLADVVTDLVRATQEVRTQVQETTALMRDDQSEAETLQQRVHSLEQELAQLSREVTTDHLTEVMNRRGLQQAFDAEQSRAQRAGHALSIALLDVDDFKRLNDDLGHQAGDDALKFLADQIKSALRPTDSVARYGGEEFVVLLPATPVQDAQLILSRLQRQLSAKLFQTHAGSAFVTFSAGTTLYREPERMEEALDRADEALYQAKRTGKNRTVIAP